MNVGTIMNKNTENIKDSEIAWIIINAYFSNKHLEQLVRHQIESFNDFPSIGVRPLENIFNLYFVFSVHPPGGIK